MTPPEAVALLPTVAVPRAHARARARGVARAVAPAWFAGVMGTGIVAVAAELLPVRAPAIAAGAVVLWGAAATLLVVLVVATAVAAAAAAGGGRARLRALLADPATAPTLGVPPMALMTVGAATLLAGRRVVGADAALTVAAALWALGTAGGLLTAVAVPHAMVTRHRLRVADASGAWLLPVVPPLVSATTGAGLVAHVPPGEARLDLVLGLYALFGLSLVTSLLIVGVAWARLLLHGPGPAVRAPSLWVVLGPLGQAITAANLLGAASATAVGAPYADALRAFGVLCGLPLLGFAALWLALAVALTGHHASRDGLPFSAAWWSFVFPVGTLVTGTSVLADRTGSHALAAIAVALFAVLVALWATTAARSGRHLRSRLAGA